MGILSAANLEAIWVEKQLPKHIKWVCRVIFWIGFICTGGLNIIGIS